MAYMMSMLESTEIKQFNHSKKIIKSKNKFISAFLEQLS